MREIPKSIKIKGYNVQIVAGNDYGIYASCKENSLLNISLEMNQIDKEKVDLIYAKSYKEGCTAYSERLLKLYDVLFAKLRETGKKLK